MCWLVGWCIFTDENTKIALKLSTSYNIQSRFITKFHNINKLFSSNENVWQGFVVDMTCDGFESIFDQVFLTFISNDYIIINIQVK